MKSGTFHQLSQIITFQNQIKRTLNKPEQNKMNSKLLNRKKQLRNTIGKSVVTQIPSFKTSVKGRDHTIFLLYFSLWILKELHNPYKRKVKIYNLLI